MKKMTLKQAIKIVESHNKWRRGGRGKMGDVKQLGIAIDVLLVVASEYIKLYDMNGVKITTKQN